MPVGVKIAVDTSGLAAVSKESRQRTITLKAVRAGARILRDAARARAPRRVGSGALRHAQGIKAAKGRRGKTLSYAAQGAKIGVQKAVTTPGRRTPQTVVPALYDHLVQGGTKPHAVRGRGQHPGARPNPYRRDAYESKKAEIGQAMRDTMAAELRKVIDREAKRLAAKQVK